LPFEKLHSWEVSTWEIPLGIAAWEKAVGKVLRIERAQLALQNTKFSIIFYEHGSFTEI